MLERGSLLVQKTCILYFEVADGGDLHNYFLKEPTIPRSVPEITSFLWRFYDILDALAFLHEDLVKAENPSEVWRFAHLDLRPANILIFKASDRYDREIWKIHDFGISKVKKAMKGDEVTGWRKMFRSDTEDLTASGTLRARGSTTFLAPEYKNFTIGEMASVTYKADIWSFGCIMSVGLSFLGDGSESVKDFSKKRKDRAGVEDVFFVSEGQKRFRMVKPGIKLNPAVSEYFGIVQSNIESGTCAHLQPTFRKITDFLMQKALAPVPKARVRAKEGADQLRDILLNLDHIEDETGKHETKNKLWKKIIGESAEPAVDPTQESKTFELILPEGSNSCKFSYCGKYLAYFSTNSIAFCETVSIFRGGYAPAAGGKQVRLLKPPAEFKWRGFDINSKYLVAYTDAKYFDVRISVVVLYLLLANFMKCYIYPHLAQPDRDVPTSTPDHYRFTIHNSSSIHFAALSPDPVSGLLATALISDDQTYHVYLCEVSNMIKYHDGPNGVPNMISTPTTSMNLSPSHRTYPTSSSSTSRSANGGSLSQTASSKASDFQSPPQLPWEGSLLHSAEVGKKSELTHIHSMQFSADSKIFTVLSQPPKANKLAWYCWDTLPTRRANTRIGLFTRGLQVCDSTSCQTEKSMN
jgi:serine/threonine protein kinase